MSSSPVERLDVDPFLAHGFLGDRSWPLPRRVVRCDDLARPGYDSKAAHEFLDEPEVLKAKMAVVADLIRRAKKPIAYTGAGISTASGIGDYASRAAGDRSMVKKVQGGRKLGFDARPTKAHRVLAAVAKEGMLHRWIQQNHDGLPQKAGVPQSLLNEIHGSWYDPSNPVVKMSGSLRDDLFSDLLECEEETDLCLCAGTSLAGMNADRVVETVGTRAAVAHAEGSPSDVLGSVIMSIQCTRLDSVACIRVFALLDDAFTVLAKELGLAGDVKPDRVLSVEDLARGVPPSTSTWTMPTVAPTATPAGGAGSEGTRAPGFTATKDLYLVPYGEDGKLLPAGAPLRYLDLRENKNVTITSGPYAAHKATMSGHRSDGNYRITLRGVLKRRDGTASDTGAFAVVMGKWWVAAAVAGAVPSIPIATRARKR